MKKRNVDKGFELGYHNLSYRRKFIRTLWMIPLAIVALYLMHKMGYTIESLLLCAVFFTVSISLQSRVNYKKWKEETESKDI